MLPHEINCSTNSPYEFNLFLISLCFSFLSVKGYILGNVIVRITHEIHDLGEVGEPSSLRGSGTNSLMRKVFGIADPALVHRGGGVILNSLSILYSLGGQPCTSPRGDVPGIGNMYSKSTRRSSVKRICPRNCYICSHPVLGFDLLHIVGACSFLTNSRGKGRESSSRWVSRTGSIEKQTVLWQSPLLLIPNIYISSTATPHSKDRIHLT